VKAFSHALGKLQPPSTDRRWLFVPYDQLSDRIGPLAAEDPGDIGVLLIENRWQLARRPYHREKLASVIANMRHFALEQAARGVAVRYFVADSPYRNALRPLLSELGPLRVMEPAERELRVDLAPLVERKALRVLPHEGWLTTHEQVLAARPKGPPWRMDAFYRSVRRSTGVLMSGDRPEGGKFSFDPENRLPWRGDPPAPRPPRFAPDDVTEEVGSLVESDFARHPGRLDLASLPASSDDAERLWAWARRRCLPHFGPYEDAMSAASSTLFHTRLSPLVNLHRLLPSRLVAGAERMNLVLPSKEGFIRQILGWREFVRHVHLASDGFRRLPQSAPPIAAEPGDAGYRRWSGDAWHVPHSPSDLDGGAQPCFLGGDTPLPPVYWGRLSGLACLDGVVSDVWREGWSHHITRLVILCGIATMLDVSPRELADWFWVAYADAYDWVVEPNVLGMGMFAIGDYMSTKPYVTGASYIHRMSDYCPECAFDPRRSCPITSLYWAFIARHEKPLGSNPRMQIPLAAMRKRSLQTRRRDRQVYETMRQLLGAGRRAMPQVLSPSGTAR
jgi:deoxyribodipyrimidine photolyase-related protein